MRAEDKELANQTQRARISPDISPSTMREKGLHIGPALSSNCLWDVALPLLMVSFIPVVTLFTADVCLPEIYTSVVTC